MLCVRAVWKSKKSKYQSNSNGFHWYSQNKTHLEKEKVSKVNICIGNFRFFLLILGTCTWYFSWYHHISEVLGKIWNCNIKLGSKTDHIFQSFSPFWRPGSKMPKNYLLLNKTFSEKKGRFFFYGTSVVLQNLSFSVSGYEAVVRPKVKQLLIMRQKVAWYIGMRTGNRIIIAKI